MTPQMERRIVRLLHMGFTIQHVAQTMDTTVPAVRNVAKHHNIPARTRRATVCTPPSPSE